MDGSTPKCSVEVGRLNFFNRVYDSLRAKRCPLARVDSCIERVTASEDPIIQNVCDGSDCFRRPSSMCSAPASVHLSSFLTFTDPLM